MPGVLVRAENKHKGSVLSSGMCESECGQADVLLVTKASDPEP